VLQRRPAGRQWVVQHAAKDVLVLIYFNLVS
jgi:hypothetical protein